MRYAYLRPARAPAPELAAAAARARFGRRLLLPPTRQPLDADQALALARRLKALADPARLRLLSLIAAHEGGEACVCDLTEPLGLSQPTVSHHLKVLVEAGLLTRDKRGVWAYFTVVPQALDALAAVLATPSGRAPAANPGRGPDGTTDQLPFARS